MNKITVLKPVAWLLRVFLCFPMFLYSRHSSHRVKPSRAARKALYNMHNWHGLVLWNLHNFQLFRPFPFFSQVRLDGFNYYIFPPCFAQMKWKIDGSSGHKYECALHFLHFSQQYTVHIIAWREKNRAGFSHVRVCGLGQTNFSPVIYAYIQS